MWAPDSGEFVCARCGTKLIAEKDLSRDLRRVFRFQAWFDDVCVRGLNGPSPGAAAAQLGCHRTMVDKLVDRGILEKSVYDKDGHYVVLISRRSIEKAKENKKNTGKWTDSGDV